MIDSTIHSTAVQKGRGTLGFLAAGAVTLAAGLAAWGTYGESGEQSNREFLVVAVIIAVATAGVFGWLVPRAVAGARAGVAGVALSVLGILTIPVFWSGLPVILGAAGIAVGLARWDGPLGTTAARIGLALGALAILADVAVYIGDMAS